MTESNVGPLTDEETELVCTRYGINPEVQKKANLLFHLIHESPNDPRIPELWAELAPSGGEKWTAETS